MFADYHVICITDHVDYGVKEDWDSGAVIEYRDGDPLANVDYPRYMTQIRKMQVLYGDKIKIRIGMEFGMQMHTVPRYEELFHRYGLNDTMPSKEILKLYRELGFKEFCTYEQMKPVFHAL